MEYEIYHAFFKKGDKKKNHKYVARIGESPKYRYFYTNAEYQAYLKLNKIKSDIGNRINSAKTDLKGLTNSGKNYLTSFQNRVNLSNFSSSVSSKISSFVSKVSSTPVSNVAAKAKEFIQSPAKKKAVNLVTANEAVKAIKNAVAKPSENKTKLNGGKGAPGKLNVNIKPELSSQDKKALNVLSSWRDGIKEMLKQVTRPNPPSFKALKVKKTEMSKDEDMARVNPYVNEDHSFTINCAYCTAAYDLRRRGYDVEADDYYLGTEPDERKNTLVETYTWYTHKNKENIAHIDNGTKIDQLLAKVLGYKNVSEKRYYEKIREQASETEKNQAYLDAYYPGVHVKFKEDGYTASSIEKELLKQGNGASGRFDLSWSNGGGHSVIYEVEDNKVILRDCQTNKTLKIEDYYQYADYVMYWRTDNEEPTSNILRSVKNKASDTTNPGKGNGSKTTPADLAQKYEDAGYKTTFTTINGDYGYKVYLSDTRYLIIDPDTGATKYVDEKLKNRGK